MSVPDSITATSSPTVLVPAQEWKVTTANKLVSRLRVFAVSMTVENRLLWPKLRGRHNPRADLAGPYHIVGSPRRDTGNGTVVMASLAELKAHTPFLLAFTVKDHEGKPVENAQADWWQADTAGNCYHSTYALRGKFVTDAEGRAEVLTVSPGAYGPAGGIRAGHFHVIITPPGRNAQELTTQMYVCRANDPAELQTDLLNSYRKPRPQNILQCWTVSSENGNFMDLPELSADDVKTAARLEGWNAKLATLDPSLHVVAGAQTELQLSARSRFLGI